MTTIQRVRFPISNEKAGLYLKLSGGTSSDLPPEEAIYMKKGDRASFDTYFNSFYEKCYLECTNIRDIKYMLKLKGSFRINITRECLSLKKENLHTSITPDFDSIGSFETPLLHLNPIDRAGRIYFELECLSEKGIFLGASLVSPAPPVRDISIAVVICTFKRIESVKGVLEKIFTDAGLCERKIDVLLVDNASQFSKEDLPYEKLKIFHSANLGGSGGFTCGILECLENKEHTHIVLMDDDIILESESLYRLFGIYNHAVKDICVAGQLLDSIRDYTLYEAGAKYTYFRIIPRKHKLSLKNSSALNILSKKEDINYGGFWFSSMSKSIIEMVGLPLPLFKHFDDIELGIRMKEDYGIDIVSFPGVAVWHKPFDIGRKEYESYYIVRNMLVINVIHRRQPYFLTTFLFTGYILLNTLRLCFNRAKMAIDAIADYLKGPEYLIKDQAALNAVILDDFEKYASLSFWEKFGYIVDYLKKWSILVCHSHAQWNCLAKEWNEFYIKAVTKEFWKKYLSLPEE